MNVCRWPMSRPGSIKGPRLWWSDVRATPSTSRQALKRTREDAFGDVPDPRAKSTPPEAIAGVVPPNARQTRVARLFQKFGPIIYVRCRRMLKERAAAEDATQEVFLKVI